MVGAGLLVTGLLLGLGSEWVGYGWLASPVDWGADLLVGLVWIGCGVWAGRGGRGRGVLFVAVGVAWFLGGYLPAATYWHRGALVHLLVTYPQWRTGGRLGMVTVAAGYAAALLYSPWQNELSGALLAVALCLVLVRLRSTAVGRRRRYRSVALGAAAMLGSVLVGGSLARSAVPMQEAVRPALLAFETALCGIALLLVSGLRRPAEAPVTDLVVELGESRWGTLSGGLARLLGDPELEVGYWVPAMRGYVDGAGRTVAVPKSGERRCATRIEREGRPFAVIVHDIAVLEDPRLVSAVAAATRLTASHAALQADVHTRLRELTASRRRLVVAADGERARLEERLRQGAERRLRALGERLAATAPDGPTGDEPHRLKAAAHVAKSLDELRTTARGLRPRELADGIRPALASLCADGALAAVSDGRSIEVRWSATPERFGDEVETAVYYACAEAVTDAAKHSGADVVSVDVRRDGEFVTLEVADQGVGGADLGRGTGLVGVADRVAALGGQLTVSSPPGGGTRLSAAIPLNSP